MDITKLFDREDKNAPPIESEKLEAMIDRAVAYPQIRQPANQNTIWIRRSLGIAAAIVIAVTVSLQFMPASNLSTSSANPAADTSADNSDAYGEISDLLILETLNDLS